MSRVEKAIPSEFLGPGEGDDLEPADERAEVSSIDRSVLLGIGIVRRRPVPGRYESLLRHRGQTEGNSPDLPQHWSPCQAKVTGDLAKAAALAPHADAYALVLCTHVLGEIAPQLR